MSNLVKYSPVGKKAKIDFDNLKKYEPGQIKKDDEINHSTYAHKEDILPSSTKSYSFCKKLTKKF